MTLRQHGSQLVLRTDFETLTPDADRMAMAWDLGRGDSVVATHLAKNGGEDGPQIEEKRRRCLVAITRASQSLTLNYARSYFRWASTRSRCLEQMDCVESRRRRLPA